MTLKIPPTWWKSDQYTDATPMPDAIAGLGGPEGPGLIRVFDDGRTLPGWGLTGAKGGEGFMPRYNRREFRASKALYAYNKVNHPFAFIMRSLNIVAIDIDGKNGGLDHAVEFLGNAPPTLAETSRSGNGFHLFYSTNELWDETTGYGELLGDHIGIVQGVDVRSTGCVYHFNTQRWNDRLIAPLPSYMETALLSRQTIREHNRSRISKIMEMEPEDRLMMQSELETELEKPIPAGKRNNTLYAIGVQMHQAAVPDWDTKLIDRAVRAGLTYAEAAKIADNVEKYN